MEILNYRHNPALRLAAFAAALGLATFLYGCDPATAPESLAQPAPGAVAAKSGVPANTGLEFPSNGDTWADVRFQWKGASLLPMYPATYVWRVKERLQEGYYSILLWGPDKDFISGSYYGAQPFPQAKGDKSRSKIHRWAITAGSREYNEDLNGHPTELGHGEWKTQALRVYDNGSFKVHDYFWDLPDTTKVIRTLLAKTYGAIKPPTPVVTVGAAPWDPRSTRLAGIVRGLQIYNAKLSGEDVLGELAAPMGTKAGKSAIWYLNLNPTPDDITDKSGHGNNPAWVSSTKASLWTEPPPAPPQVTLMLTPATVGYGEAAALSWTSADADVCVADGAWTGQRELQGSETVTAPEGVSDFALECSGPGGSVSASAQLTVLPPKPAPLPEPLPIPPVNADPIPAPTPEPIPEIPPADSSKLGLPVPPADVVVEPIPAPTPTPDPVPPVVLPLPEPPSVTLPLPLPIPPVVLPLPEPVPPVTLPLPDPLPPVAVPSTPKSGLDFNGNDDAWTDARFRFTGTNLQPMYPATYVFRVNPRKQAGYYTTFFWGPEGEFNGKGYYGAHPYPAGEPKDESLNHNWELSISGHDYIDDENKHATGVEYGRWHTQALRVWDNGMKKVHEFYWDLPDTTKVIRVELDQDYGPNTGFNSLSFGNSQFSPISEHCNCTLNGVQTYAASLSPTEIISEIQSPLSTPAGKEGVWYLNISPTPDDISDKSGKGHHPEWAKPERAKLWLP